MSRVTRLGPGLDLGSVWLLSESLHAAPGLCSLTASPLAPSPCSVRERCLEEQKRRRQRATKKISTFIGTFLVCFAPYVITR